MFSSNAINYTIRIGIDYLFFTKVGIIAGIRYYQLSWESYAGLDTELVFFVNSYFDTLLYGIRHATNATQFECNEVRFLKKQPIRDKCLNLRIRITVVLKSIIIQDEKI